ncbi:MAG: hypothetical protein WBP85_16025 [Terracidiphilus sp.]
MIEQSERSRHLIEVSRRAMHRGHDAWATFNLSDKVSVALVLNRADWLEEFGCTLAEAIEAAGEEWIVVIPRIARELLDEGL